MEGWWARGGGSILSPELLFQLFFECNIFGALISFLLQTVKSTPPSCLYANSKGRSSRRSLMKPQIGFFFSFLSFLEIMFLASLLYCDNDSWRERRRERGREGEVQLRAYGWNKGVYSMSPLTALSSKENTQILSLDVEKNIPNLLSLTPFSHAPLSLFSCGVFG